MRSDSGTCGRGVRLGFENIWRDGAELRASEATLRGLRGVFARGSALSGVIHVAVEAPYRLQLNVTSPSAHAQAATHPSGAIWFASFLHEGVLDTILQT